MPISTSKRRAVFPCSPQLVIPQIEDQFESATRKNALPQKRRRIAVIQPEVLDGIRERRNGPVSSKKSQFKQIENKLREKRKEIATNSSARLGTDSGTEYGRDEGDRANASQAKEMTWLRSSQERGLLSLIDAAIARIQGGSFGECLHCGQEIGEKRLSAIPWTEYCITCQELLEHYGT